MAHFPRRLFPAQTEVSPSGITRPISPDLAIWRFSPTAYLHVGVRISGAMLSVGLMGAGIDAAVSSEPHVYGILQSLQDYPVILPVAKAAVVAPLTYHFVGGVRQIYHDVTAKGIDTEFQDKSSIAMAAITGLVTVAAMVY